jgi:hypothetical protein
MKGKACAMSSPKNPSEKSSPHNKSMTKEELIELLRKLPPKARLELLLKAKQRKEDKLIE